MLNKNYKKAFTLVELLVVITILAIISVVAYQSFSGATDKAVWARKISDVATIETWLQMYKSSKWHYPPVDSYNLNTNKWWYNNNINATKSNTIGVDYNWQEINSIILAAWWWKIMWSWSLNTTQIWSKWTISQNTLWKQYLTKDLYDPELWDTKIWTKKMIDYWIGRYVYAIYKKWTANKSWNAYNIAYTLKKDESDKYVTKIAWDYDEESCYDDRDNCPKTLIGPGDWYLIDWDEQKMNNWIIDTNANDQWIPYPITDFTWEQKSN